MYHKRWAWLSNRIYHSLLSSRQNLGQFLGSIVLFSYVQDSDKGHRNTSKTRQTLLRPFHHPFSGHFYQIRWNTNGKRALRLYMRPRRWLQSLGSFTHSIATTFRYTWFEDGTLYRQVCVCHNWQPCTCSCIVAIASLLNESRRNRAMQRSGAQ